MPLVAGIDSSTQSCTVELRDADTGELLGGGRSPHPPTAPPLSEQDPNRWWEALAAALRQAARVAGRPLSEIRAMSVAGQCHGLVMLDAAGRPLRPAKLWNDTQSTPEAIDMVDQLGPGGWARMVGSTPTAAFTISKLAWVAHHEPRHLQNLVHLLLPHDYLTFRLTGRAVTDRSEASGTGYFAAHSGQWRTDLLDRFVTPLDWAAKLPTVLAPDESAGELTADAAATLGLRPGTLVGPGAGDTHAGALGLGVRDGDIGYSLGTSGVVFSSSRHPVFDESGWVDGVADATGGYLPLVCTLNAAKVTDTFARLLSVSLDQLSALALAADPAPDRPVLAAYLDGERSPNRPAAAGTLHGLTSATTPEQLARSAFEGVLLGLNRGQRALENLGIATDLDVLLTGGGARSAAYRQILADLLQRPVLLKNAPEAAARGAAIQAATILAGVTTAQTCDEWQPTAALTVEPREAPPAIESRYTTVADWCGADTDQAS